MTTTVNISISGNGGNLEGDMTDCGDVKRLEQINFSVLPSGGHNQNSNSKQGAKEFESEQSNERKKKTRRGKPKRKKPYNKELSESRVKNYQKSRTNCARFRNRQPVAPNNTNQFLMEDHTDLQELDERLQATANRTIEQQSNNIAPQRPARARDSSFTSQDSDEDYFYSSPEDEEEFLTKEFSNTYQDLHVESLTSMSKTELIQQVLQLEERIDSMEKRMGTKNKPEDKPGENDKDGDKTAEDYKKEIEKLKIMNEQLVLENERLQRENRSSSVSSVDSESDSSTTSDSSGSSGSDAEKDGEVYVEDKHTNTVNNGLIVAQGICNMESEDMT